MASTDPNSLSLPERILRKLEKLDPKFIQKQRNEILEELLNQTKPERIISYLDKIDIEPSTMKLTRDNYFQKTTD
jgi:mRNA-degrading endonuclease RelE of RelBE toxin-antitoxin system